MGKEPASPDAMFYFKKPHEIDEKPRSMTVNEEELRKEHLKSKYVLDLWRDVLAAKKEFIARVEVTFESTFMKDSDSFAKDIFLEEQ